MNTRRGTPWRDLGGNLMNLGRMTPVQLWSTHRREEGNHPSLPPFPSVFRGFNGASRSVYLR